MHKAPTHVSIGEATYRLGQTSRNDTQVACVATDGLVHRVCAFSPSWHAGIKVYTGGEHLHFRRMT